MVRSDQALRGVHTGTAIVYELIHNCIHCKAGPYVFHYEAWGRDHNWLIKNLHVAYQEPPRTGVLGQVL